MAELTETQTRLLRFWGANMTFAFRKADWFPGFSYTPEERARLKALAETVPSPALAWWMYGLVPAIFMAIAALAIAGFMLPVLTYLYPNPADTKPLVFVVVLAVVAFASLGVGLPIAMSAGGRLALRLAGDTGHYVAAPGDAALYAKFRRQIWRVVLVTCGLFIPGCWLWILFDLDAGPVVAVIKLVIALWIAVSGFATWRLRP